MLTKLRLLPFAVILFIVNSFPASAQFDWNWGSSYSIINDTWSIPTPAVDAFIQSYKSGNTGSSVNDWGVDATSNVVLPETYEYVNNGDGTSSIQEKPDADYSKYDEDEIVKPFQYPDNSTAVRIEFTLDGDNDIIISMTDDTEYPNLDTDPYDDKIYDIYDFDGKPGGKYARTQVGERILTGWPGYGYIYPDALYAVVGYPEDTSSDSTAEEGDTEIIDASVCDDKTSVTFDVSGKVYHDPSGIEIAEAHYDPTVDKIFYVDDGQVTQGTYGNVLTLTGGCISVDEASFALQYPESVIEEEGHDDESAGSADLIGNPVNNMTDPNSITVPFEDVPNNSKYNSVRWMYSQGVVEGYSDGTFKPDKLVNRVEFLKMLYETVGIDSEYEEVELPFPDVPAGEWYSKYVRKAYKYGIVEGYPDGYFRPENTINFAEAVKIVANFFLNTDTRFAETSYSPCIDDLSEDMTGEWFWKYFHVADSVCVIPEDLFLGDGTFDPGAQVTRFHMADLLYRAKAISENNYEKFNDTLIPIDVYEP